MKGEGVEIEWLNPDPPLVNWYGLPIPNLSSIGLTLPNGGFIQERGGMIHKFGKHWYGYRRFAELRSLDELETIDTELRDRFGPTPNEVLNLLYQLKVKIIATNAGIDRILNESGQILIELPEKRTVPDIHTFGEGIRRSKRGLWLSTEVEGNWEKRLLMLLNHILKKA